MQFVGVRTEDTVTEPPSQVLEDHLLQVKGFCVGFCDSVVAFWSFTSQLFQKLHSPVVLIPGLLCFIE